MRVALTGATGFIGRAIARRLIEDGYAVRALARQPRALFDESGLEPVHGHLDDADALQRLCDGADMVVHCAGAVKARHRAEFFAVNATATQRIAAAAARAGVARFIHISSLAAREPHISAYAASKAESEAALARETGRMHHIAIRPPAVYGPGDRESAKLLKLAATGIFPVLGKRDARFSVIYVEDLARFIVNALDHAAPSGTVLEPDDGRPGGYGWAEFAAALGLVTGRPVRLIQAPRLPFAAAAAANEALARVLGRATIFTPGKLRELTHPDWVCRSEPAAALWRGHTPLNLEDGLKATLAAAGAAWPKRAG